MIKVKTLDIGCGPKKKAGAFGVDIVHGPNVDLVHDLNKAPWPIPSDQYDRVVASHILEHVRDVKAVLDEIHRVAKHGAKIEIVTPHFSNRSAYADPTHCHAFSARFIDFFCGGKPRPMGFFNILTHYLFEHRFVLPAFDDPPKFRCEELNLSFSRIFRLLPIQWAANRYLDFYEFYFAYFFPARDIFATLTVIKEDQ